MLLPSLRPGRTTRVIALARTSQARVKGSDKKGRMTDEIKRFKVELFVKLLNRLRRQTEQ